MAQHAHEQNMIEPIQEPMQATPVRRRTWHRYCIFSTAKAAYTVISYMYCHVSNCTVHCHAILEHFGYDAQQHRDVTLVSPPPLVS